MSSVNATILLIVITVILFIAFLLPTNDEVTNRNQHFKSWVVERTK